MIADAMDAAGLRGVLCYEVTDRDGMDKMHAGIDENLRFMYDCIESGTDSRYVWITCES